MNSVELFSKDDPSTQEAAAIIKQHAPLVKRIAYHLIAKLPHTVDVDDLIQEGMIGLLNASHNYSSEHGASFDTYAGIRIRGAMLDEIRRNNWTPRSVHKKAREIGCRCFQIWKTSCHNRKEND